MKSKHLARADFLRELRRLTSELYALGDFTVDSAGRAALQSKIAGFIDAGLLIGVSSREDMQSVIDKCHLEAFGESRSERKQRIADKKDAGAAEVEVREWDVFDSPAFERAKTEG